MKRIDSSLLLINTILFIACIIKVSDAINMESVLSVENVNENIHIGDIFFLYILLVLLFYKIKPSYNEAAMVLSKGMENWPITLLIILIWLSSGIFYFKLLNFLFGIRKLYDKIYYFILLILSLLLFFEIGYSYFKSKKANSMEK